MTPCATLISSSPQTSRLSDEIRKRALERLYERLDTVDELILALENYIEERRSALAPCIPISAARKWS